MSLVGRLFNVFATPSDVFDEVKAAPPNNANWLVPALILIVVSWIAAAVIFSQPAIKHQLSELTEQGIQRQIDSGRLSEQQAESARAVGEKWAMIVIQVAGALAPVAIGLILPFVWGLFLWLLGTQAFKCDFPYTKAVEMVGLANMILVLEAIVKALLVLGLGNLYASPSLALLVNHFDPQNPLHALLAAVNLMTFWLLAVRAIGLSRLSGASLAKAVAWVFAIWAAYTGLFIGLSALAQAGAKKLTG